MKFTLLECTIQWFLVYLQSRATITSIKYPPSLLPILSPAKTLYPLTSLSIPCPPQSLATTTLYSDCMDVPLAKHFILMELYNSLL